MMNVYAIYDRLAETYGNPFILDVKVAKRTFEWMKRDTELQQRQDKEVRLLGTWNPEKGIETVYTPEKVYELDDKQEEQ
nr:unnamed protein product [uncultured bacterium]